MAEDRKLFDRNVDNSPSTDLRVAFGADGVLILNMTFANFFVYLKANISYDDTYLNKTNEYDYIPTLDYHPATKKYVDDSAIPIGGVVDNANEQGWTELTGDMRLMWFRFTSTIEGDQVVPFPYTFPNACVSVTLGSQAFALVSKTGLSMTVNRWNNTDGTPVVYVQAIGY